MCECQFCGASVPCRNPNCTNDECPDCRQLREDAESLEWAQKRDAQHAAQRTADVKEG